ncbi:hypothetical protein BDR03DRAFT_974918 [Suillus americanus]|nr:hypothetical protein BDR03DRAFT_974918 [Suillus americanus]
MADYLDHSSAESSSYTHKASIPMTSTSPQNKYHQLTSSHTASAFSGSLLRYPELGGACRAGSNRQDIRPPIIYGRVRGGGR